MSEIRSSMSSIPAENWDKINWKDSISENDKKMDKIIEDTKKLSFEQTKDYGRDL